jgi:ABC-2 type transport system permease protein
MSGGRRRAWLVARREWIQRVRTTSFRVSTLISILIVVAIVLVPDVVGGDARRERTVGTVGETSAELPALFRASGEQLDLTVTTRPFADEAAGIAALRSGDVAVLLVDQEELIWKASPDDRLAAIVSSSVGALERRDAVADLDLSSEEAARLTGAVDLPSRSLEPATAERTEREELAFIALLVLFLALSVYGGFLVTGVVEEKSSRVVEVLLARLRPAELLAGKILGIGMVGLAQLALVAASALIALRFAENPSATTTPGTIAWIVFWFVLGYGFYAVLDASAGSLVSRQEEAQSIQFPVSAVLIVAYFVSMQAAQTPDSTAALIGSLVPPTAPMVMLARIAHGAVPWWQIVASVGLMIVTVYGLVQLAGRIYTGAVLRFGARLRLKEAWRSAEA